MAESAAVTNIGNVPGYRQVISPSYQQASFTPDDTDNHDFVVDARGKSAWSAHINNDGNQTLTVTVYGAPDSTAEVGDQDVVQIGQFTVSANSPGYETVADPFPFYLLRATYGSTPTGTTTVLYAHFHS